MKKSEAKRLIVKECIRQGLNKDEQIAYVLATVEWETAGTFKPIKEAFWLSENWRKTHLKYYPYYGRGYVQITWKRNYKRFSTILGIDLVNNPDLALKEKYARFILVYGFKYGIFTGKKITDYINEKKVDFKNARRCINGKDKAYIISKIAKKYLKELKKLKKYK